MSKNCILLIGVITLLSYHWLPAQISLIADINPGSNWSSISEMVVLNDAIYFNATNGAHAGLYTTDGDTVVLVTDVGDNINTREFIAADDYLAWAGKRYLGGVGNSAWFYTPEEYYGLGVFDFISNLVKYKGDIFFAGAKSNGTELYKIEEVSDPFGDYYSTTLIFDRDEQGFYGGSLAPSFFTPHSDGILYFLSWSNNSDAALWRTDGTEAGTFEVISLPYFNNLYAAGDKLFMHDSTFPAGTEERTLWISDGTAAGTDSLENVRFFLDPYVVDSFIYFRNYTPSTGSELWVTDGTQSGTHIVDDYMPGSASTTDIKVVGRIDSLLFLSGIGATGPSLFTIDIGGDSLAFIQQLDISDEPGAVMGDYFYFGADDFEFGTELWRTDGTEMSTEMLGDINPVGNANPARITAHDGDGLILFSAYTDALGFELYKYQPELGDEPCMDHLTLDGTPTQELYAADSSIISSQIIPYDAQANVNHYTYRSRSVSLGHPFEVEAQAIFNILIGGCDE